MKAVLTSTIIGALCLVTIVLAAPRPTSVYPELSVPVCTADSATWVRACCMSKKLVAKQEVSAPVMHESADFLVW